jgi:GAF domain-containing protein
MPRPSIPATASAAALPDALAALSQYFISHATMVEALQRVGQITLSALQRANSVAVSMTVDGRLGAHTYSDPQVEDVDRLQYETGNGPSVDTLLNGEVVVIRSTTSDGPYAAFRRAAIGAGVRSVLCLPMHTGTKIIGALTFYSTDEDAFAATDIEVGSTFAKQAAFVLANAQAYWDARTLSENLTQAMQSRAEIEQAKGIIMATAGLSADAAFEQLVKQSQHENVKVRDLATEIVRRSQRSRPQ